MSFNVGQRWISDAESELGLGIVVNIEGRMLTLYFPATEENRYYAIEEAPVTRVKFNVGDEIISNEDWPMMVTRVEEEQGLVTYYGVRSDDEAREEIALKELFLNHFLKFNKPQDRLFAGQVDRFDNFVMRYKTLQQQYDFQLSPLRGLLGPRVGLIAHQLYIANEVGQRMAPRVLLSDEVGLGKTIEAGLIIHQQLQAGLAKRVLVVVPDALQYQWLVEMLRRFNLRFSIFDEERCIEAYADADNPFDTEQLIICSLDFIRKSKRRFDQVTDSEWDLLVVDEAHHLQWSEDKPSREYQVIEALAENTPSVLLLTATPDQLGHQSHFARLRLLDPARFHDYAQFLAEEQSYQAVATAAESLLGNASINKDDAQALRELLAENDISALLTAINDGDDANAQQAARNELLQHLLDRHGTGRVLFRNTRSAIKGFPVRKLSAYPLALPEQYQTALRVNQMMGNASAQTLLYPEELYQQFAGDGDNDISWGNYDPRINWLTDFLLANKGDKVLLICTKAKTALAIEELVRVNEGIRATVFHEGMSILERDKAAAYFAQQEDGAQLLVCSEVGSEGRNFQFAKHLVLFDLPTNPDLLEQRIGRLDRIGQRFDVNIHVPYLQHTPQHTLLRWYHEGLNAFEKTCACASALFEEHRDTLLDRLATWDEEALNALVEQTHIRLNELTKALEQGRDKLLELHSCGNEKAQALVDALTKADDDHQFVSFSLRLFDIIGISQEDRGENALVLKPSEQMLVPSLAGLPEDGCTITYDRDTALSRDDVQFMTWEHPLIASCIDTIVSSDMGTTSVALLKNRALEVGSVFVEAVYVLEASGPSHYQLERYLPATPLRMLLDKNANSLGDKVAFEQFNSQLSPVNRHLAAKLVSASQSIVHPLLETAQIHADKQACELREQAQTRFSEKLQSEIDRLEALRAINPSVREDEITRLRELLEHGQSYLAKAQLKLDALRVILVSHN